MHQLWATLAIPPLIPSKIHDCWYRPETNGAGKH